MSTAIVNELQVFLCPKQPGGFHISRIGCAKQWRKGNELHQRNKAKEWNLQEQGGKTKEVFESSTLYHCVNCEIGKKNAQGEDLEMPLVPVSSLGEAKSWEEFTPGKNGNSLGETDTGKKEEIEETPVINTRRCSRCKKSYPRTIEYFYRRPDGPEGLSYVCKYCEKVAKEKYPKAPGKEPVTGVTKICGKCGQEKLVEEFYANREKRGGRSNRCKACEDAWQKLKRDERRAQRMSEQLKENTSILPVSKPVISQPCGDSAIRLIFGPEDQVLLDQLLIMAKKERRAPDQQVMVILETLLVANKIGIELGE